MLPKLSLLKYISGTTEPVKALLLDRVSWSLLIISLVEIKLKNCIELIQGLTVRYIMIIKKCMGMDTKIHVSLSLKYVVF